MKKEKRVKKKVPQCGGIEGGDEMHITCHNRNYFCGK
jgi:hypothetical protein